MNDRAAFLHFLYNKTKLTEIAISRVSNMQYNTTRIIGFNKEERKKTLSTIYNMYIKDIPQENLQKKKPTFFLNVI